MDLARTTNDPTTPISTGPSYAALLRDYVLIGVALLYVIGFCYYYNYLSRFGIGFSFRDIPIYQLFVYGYSAINWVIIAIVAIAALLIIIFHVGYMQMNEEERGAVAARTANYMIIFIIAVAALLFCGIFAGKEGAMRTDSIRTAGAVGCGQVGDVTVGNQVVFVFTQQAPTRILKANSDGRLQMIFETPDMYYFLIHECHKTSAKSALEATDVFAVRRSDVVFYGVGMPK